MLRLFLLFLGLLVGVFLYFRVESQPPAPELPIFLRQDTIALAHHTSIKLSVLSKKTPSMAQQEQLRHDYADLWAHLNHLYATNDVEAGKEYYTEEWFRQLCKHYEGEIESRVSRTDSLHHLQIMNWSRDGLVCAAVDSNAILTYSYPDRSTRRVRTSLALVLLFQGDHWRIDAMRVLDEKEI
ncbi:hypothetical protein [Persicitalea jodogahamensis]|uniref:Uncharacterized protein n=1 Tax=Persicitalea jodogahamensis TaxID=402147 RepID=A0A8J3DBP7_9BACT|nr:hypothetical protein [Persicitalea jodogahamensis]GHB79697.1 hypothetical protein GCM10007390_37280 [Persicitalea jodogahamensis]